jgi:hypothetical protein
MHLALWKKSSAALSRAEPTPVSSLFAVHNERSDPAEPTFLVEELEYVQARDAGDFAISFRDEDGVRSAFRQHDELSLDEPDVG